MLNIPYIQGVLVGKAALDSKYNHKCLDILYQEYTAVIEFVFSKNSSLICACACQTGFKQYLTKDSDFNFIFVPP